MKRKVENIKPREESLRKLYKQTIEDKKDMRTNDIHLIYQEDIEKQIKLLEKKEIKIRQKFKKRLHKIEEEIKQLHSFYKVLNNNA